MTKPTRILLSASLALLAASQANAAIDGSIVGDGYGSALAVQGIQTQFGDNLSELDAAYAKIDGGNLHLAITGNLENNFNKLVVFFDSVAGGQNDIDPLNNPANFDSQGPGFTNLDPMVFDAGFEADYVIMARRGLGKFDFDYAKMNQTTQDADEFTDIFVLAEEGSSGPIVGTGSLASPGNGSGETFEVAYDNSNIAGVAGGEGPADQSAALAVETGFEFLIPLSALGNPSGPIKVMAYVTNGDLNYQSNQFLASLELEDFDNDPLTDPTRGNVGNFFAIDQLPGTQYFVIPNGSVPGDTDGDGDVDDSDLGTSFANYTGPVANGGKTAAQGDTDGDGDVDDSDLGTSFSNYTGPLGPASVPEPTSLALISLGGVALLRRRR